MDKELEPLKPPDTARKGSIIFIRKEGDFIENTIGRIGSLLGQNLFL